MQYIDVSVAEPKLFIFGSDFVHNFGSSSSQILPLKTAWTRNWIRIQILGWNGIKRKQIQSKAFTRRSLHLGGLLGSAPGLLVGIGVGRGHTRPLIFTHMDEGKLSSCGITVLAKRDGLHRVRYFAAWRSQPFSAEWNLKAALERTHFKNILNAILKPGAG